MDKHLPDNFGMKHGAEKFPLMVLPQVSNVCNSQCPHCWFTANPELRQRDGIPYMPKHLLTKIINEVAEHKDPKPLIRITGTGEPFLMPELASIIAYNARLIKNVRIAVITNGSKLTPERSKPMILMEIEAIEISVDASDKQTYEKLRPGLKFKTLLKNIDYMVNYRNEIKSKTKIIVSFIDNPKEIDPNAVEAFWQDKVDNVIRRKYLTYGQISEENCSEETYLSPDKRVPCPYPFERMVILASGYVTFCNFDVDKKDSYYLGNIHYQTIEEIWRNKKFEEWRNLIINRQFEKVPLCAKCNDWKYKSWNYNFSKVLKDAE